MAQGRGVMQGDPQAPVHQQSWRLRPIYEFSAWIAGTIQVYFPNGTLRTLWCQTYEDYFLWTLFFDSILAVKRSCGWLQMLKKRKRRSPRQSITLNNV